MKRFTKAVKMAAAMLSLCLVCALGVTAEAAKYQPNVTYINPQRNTATDTYFSTKKMRMGTYDDTTITVIYPKDGQISVSTNKKALQAMITEKSNENITDDDDKKVYVTPTKIYYNYSHWIPYSDGYGFYKQSVSLEETTGRYYYEKTVYNYATDENESQKVYIEGAPDIAEPYGADYVDADGDTRYTSKKDNVGFYYEDYAGTRYINSQTVKYEDGVTPDYEYAIATVQLTSTKKGTFKVNVVVNGAKSTLTVYATPDADSTFTKVKFDGKDLMSNTVKSSAKNYSSTYKADYKVKSSATSGKLKFTANKGIKITGMVVASVDKNGKPVYKKYKNGKKINLSQAYAYEEKNATYRNGTQSRSALKETFVYISYKDTYTKTSYTYSVVKKYGVKMIKEVRKAADGKKYTNFYEYGDGGHDVRLWSY